MARVHGEGRLIVGLCVYNKSNTQQKTKVILSQRRHVIHVSLYILAYFRGTLIGFTTDLHTERSSLRIAIMCTALPIKSYDSVAKFW